MLLNRHTTNDFFRNVSNSWQNHQRWKVSNKSNSFNHQIFMAKRMIYGSVNLQYYAFFKKINTYFVKI